MGREKHCSSIPLSNLKFLVIAFEAYALGLHSDDLIGNFSYAAWDSESKTDANFLLNVISTCIFEMIMLHLVIYQYLQQLAGNKVKIQRSASNILAAPEEINEIKTFCIQISTTVHEEFSKVYKQAERMAVAVNVQCLKLRTRAHKRNQSHAQTESGGVVQSQISPQAVLAHRANIP